MADRVWTPEQLERKRAKQKEWVSRNKERVRAYQREYDKKNPRTRAPRDETPEEREARRVVERAREKECRERLKLDPARLERRRANKRKWEAVRQEKIKADPERSALRAAAQRVYRQRYIDKLKRDPSAWAVFLDKNRAYLRSYVAKIRQDPVAWAAWMERARQREARRSRNASKGSTAVGEAFRSKLYADELYSSVWSRLSHMRGSDHKDDLAAEAVLLMLSGESDVDAAIREARRSLNKDAYRTVSMDAPNRYGRTLHESLTCESAEL